MAWQIWSSSTAAGSKPARLPLSNENLQRVLAPVGTSLCAPAHKSRIKIYLSPMVGLSHLKKEPGRRSLCGPSFETPAFGGLLRMRTCFAAKSCTLRVRSAACGASPDDASHRRENHEAEHVRKTTPRPRMISVRGIHHLRSIPTARARMSG